MQAVCRLVFAKYLHDTFFRLVSSLGEPSRAEQAMPYHDLAGLADGTVQSDRFVGLESEEVTATARSHVVVEGKHFR